MSTTIESVQDVKKTPYGFRITLTGTLNVEEAEDHKFDILRQVTLEKNPFSLLVDLRSLTPIQPKVIQIIKQIVHTLSLMSIVRSAVIVQSSKPGGETIQATAVALTKNYDRVIDAAKYPDWEKRALAWIEHEIEPFPDYD
ncbi:MAG TPA: hypothetical protein VHP63_02860 [candidate division Zixibacteria bacterium]|nr:hypothetical protein [candidate division Zixibacteria bacterium]